MGLSHCNVSDPKWYYVAMKRYWVIVNGVLLAVAAAFTLVSNADAATKKSTHTKHHPAHS